jgi:hypothetical protein
MTTEARMNEPSPPRSDAPTWLVYKGRLYGIRGEPASSLADGSWVERLPSFDEQAIERAARAMSDSDDGALLISGIGPIPWEQLCDQDREDYLRHARVGLAAALEQPESSDSKP